MKRNALYLAAAALLVCSCGKDKAEGLNDSAKAHFEAWLEAHYPTIQKTDPGIYVISRTSGTGDPVGDAEQTPYVRVNYETRTIYGDYATYNDVNLARRMGTWEESAYYGPAIWARANNGLTTGADAEISAMSVGSEAEFIVPGWLNTYNRYDTESQYLEAESGTDMIYRIKLIEAVKDIKVWELDSLKRYLAKAYPSVDPADSLKEGLYYVRRKDPSTEEPYIDDDTFYINYIGRRIDGTVFDTNVADTAKKYGIWSSGKTYSPSAVSYNSTDYTEITMGGSSVVDGFAYALMTMKPNERCTAIMYSGRAYAEEGSGTSIPGWCTIEFDIDIVTKDGEYE